jgi:hypothetical protein
VIATLVCHRKFSLRHPVALFLFRKNRAARKGEHGIYLATGQLSLFLPYGFHYYFGKPKYTGMTPLSIFTAFYRGFYALAQLIKRITTNY